MTMFTIQPGFEKVPTGVYPATFAKFAPMETKNGNCHRWEFKTDDGKVLSGLSDADKHPTTANKTGRWLAAIARQPLTVGITVSPQEFIGRKYQVIIDAEGKMASFTLMD